MNKQGSRRIGRLAIGVLAGAGLLAVMLLGWTLGWFGEKEGAGVNVGRSSKVAELPPGRIFEEAAFANPALQYRPLRIIHEKLHTGTIMKLKELGYGGIVTNVEYPMYLESGEYWEILKQNVDYAINSAGLRVWIYDEEGYPSGTAGGLVLKERPDLEAQGLAVVTAQVSAGQQAMIAHPAGHGEVRFARAYEGTSANYALDSAIDLLGELDAQGNLQWTVPDGQWVVFYFVQKPFYEGTHAVNNWYEQRRYINVLERAAAEKFIELTHQRYYEHLGDYFGNGIEAFFTDEPSLIGTYLGSPPRVPLVLDPPDPNVPQLLTLNWGNQLLEEFAARAGYDLTPYLPYLVAGDSVEAKQVRWDYYRVLSDLFAANYYQVLEQFCEEKGVACSGHTLLEEHLFHHPIFEGNLMQLLSHMQYPGIDLLTAYPETAKEWAVTTAKLASSTAHFHNKERVHSEISNAFDGDEAGIAGRMGAVAVQAAFGVDTFTSYYVHDQMSDEDNRLFTDFTGRLGYMLDGGKQQTQVAVYYPIESAWALAKPPMSMSGEHFPPEAVAHSDNFRQVGLNLVENQIDFDFLDTTGILNSEIEGNELVTPTGWRFRVLVLPAVTAVDSRLLAKLEEMAEAGIVLIFQGAGREVLTERTAGLADVQARWSQLAQHAQAVQVPEASRLAVEVKERIRLDLELEQANPHILYMKKAFQGADVYLLVNTAEQAANLGVRLNSVGGSARLWDPATGKAMPLALRQHTDGRMEAALEIGPWQAAIVTVEAEAGE